MMKIEEEIGNRQGSNQYVTKELQVISPEAVRPGEQTRDAAPNSDDRPSYFYRDDLKLIFGRSSEYRRERKRIASAGSYSETLKQRVSPKISFKARTNSDADRSNRTRRTRSFSLSPEKELGRSSEYFLGRPSGRGSSVSRIATSRRLTSTQSPSRPAWLCSAVSWTVQLTAANRLAAGYKTR